MRGSKGSMSSAVRSAADTRKLMEVACGNRSAHLAVVNAALLNVYTGELIEDQSVCTWDRWIAYVGPEPGEAMGDETEVIDAEGGTLIPGLIDGHTHLAWLSAPASFLRHALTGGTTTIVTETLEPYPVAGLAGVEDFLESLRDQPIKIFATAPVMVSISKAAAGIDQRDLEILLDREDVVGLGESYWQALVQDPERYLPAVAKAVEARKTLEGHSAGARGGNLMAYTAAGITSCHEPIDPQEVLDRLRLGYHVMIREGSIRRDLEAISEVLGGDIDLRRLVLVSDGIEPADLMRYGYMEFLVQKAIDCGFEPVEAVRMASLNVAEHFRLDHLLGGIAPGRFADLVIIPDIRTIAARMVISNGKLLARDGKLLIPPRRHRFEEGMLNTIHLEASFDEEAFRIYSPEGKSRSLVRAIDMVSGLVTREVELEIDSKGGAIRAEPGRDILKVAALDRTLSPGRRFVGLIKGFGMKSGAFGCSAAWDTTDIVVVGAADADMALAVNRIVASHGGAVICEGGKILEELPLPVFGIMSEEPLEELAVKIEAVNRAASRLGVPFPDPLLTLVTLTGAAIPFLRICEEGLVDLRNGRTEGLFVSGTSEGF